MIRTLLFFTMLSTAMALFADEPTDSADTQQLNEVVVEAQMQHTAANSTTYYPDRNSKRSAQNAIDLLNQMNIPQINVNPVSGAVQTPGGDDVAIFIDMEPATQDEKDALRPEDVKKVEYLMFPSDPRYNHEKYVINITLRHYDYGGYAKLSGTGNVLAGSGSGLAYAKMAYKRMTYDLSVSDKYTDRHNTGDEQIQVFRFPDADGGVNEITRSNLLDYSRFRQNRVGASFRAKYTTEKVVLSNSIYFTAQNTPRNDNSGRLLFSSDVFQDGNYSNTLNSTYLYPRWRGNYYFDLGRDFKLNVIPSVYYEHTKYNRRYIANDADIITDAKEDAVTGELQFQLNKTFHRYHTFDINLMGIYYYDKVEYSGNTSASPTFNQFAYGGFLGYSFGKDNFYGQVVGGFAGESNKISGVRTTTFITLAELNVQYA